MRFTLSTVFSTCEPQPRLIWLSRLAPSWAPSLFYVDKNRILFGDAKRSSIQQLLPRTLPLQSPPGCDTAAKGITEPMAETALVREPQQTCNLAEGQVAFEQVTFHQLFAYLVKQG